jgi:AcrR family transcriptional regulator
MTDEAPYERTNHLSSNNLFEKFHNGQTSLRCSKTKIMRHRDKKLDRRTSRTRRSLSEALMELIQEKRFDDITIQDVIDRADVGRSTFYSHFRDKEDLFQKDWEQFLHGLAEQVEWDKAGKGKFVPTGFLFDHLKEVQSFYKGLVRSRMTDAVFKSGLKHLSQLLETGLSVHLKNRPAPALPIPILAHYVSLQLFGLLRWWLDNEMPYPPERMDAIFHDLVTPTFRDALPN